MESFVFNNFKYKLINGEVSSKDTWYFWPVKKNFVDDFEDNLKYFKTSADFSAFCPDYVFIGNEEVPGWKNNPNYWSNYLTEMYQVNYQYKPMNDTDVEVEPEYVSDESIDFFISRYPDQTHLKRMFFVDPVYSEVTSPIDGKFFTGIRTVKRMDGSIVRRIGRGFYYVRTAEELRWCANKVNGTVFDNKINIVLGDNIGTKIPEDANEYNILTQRGLKTIDFSIGSNPAQPFEGIFFGNGFRFKNIRYKCRNTVNGIIGYLGQEGKIDSIDIYDFIILECDKEIDIGHLISDGNDISVGFLCGKNNGQISNIRLNAKVIVNKFIPRMYSVTMKGSESDNAKGAENNDAYVYYPDYLCYNNPGNIVPYIGYFNEGVFATYSGYNQLDGSIHNYWSTEIQATPELKVLDNNNGLSSPIQWYYWIGQQPANEKGFLFHYTSPAYRTNVLFYDSNMFSQTNMAFYDDGKMKSPAISTLGLILADPNDSVNGMRYIQFAHYFDKSIKMQQQNRVAYYVSPIVGINNKDINNVVVSADVKLSGSFVGFMGGLIGKQNKGNIQNVTINTKVDDLLTVRNLPDDKKQYSGSYTYYLRDYLDNDNYWFPKRSIKNIGGVIGSLIVGDLTGTLINNVKSKFTNNNAVIFKNTNDGHEVEYDDYYFLNRYGGIASMVEFNSSNISDMWNQNGPGVDYDDVNNPMIKSVYITNSVFQYTEGTSFSIDNIIGYNPYHCQTMPEGNFWMLGAASPTFSEIKPTYLAVPSLIETVFYNNGGNPTSATGFIEEDGKTKYAEIIDEATRVGLFTMDQHLASPITNPNFWCINAERDLPGVSNTVRTWLNNNISQGPDPSDLKGQGYAGGVVDRLNKTYGANFDLNVQNLAGKIMLWNQNIIIDDQTVNVNNPFTDTVVPEYANITPASCRVNLPNTLRTLDAPYFVEHANDSEYKEKFAEAITGDYNGNKYLTEYPYFGSDLLIIQNSETIAETLEKNISDTINPDSYSGVILTVTGLDGSYKVETNDGDWDPFHGDHHIMFPVTGVTFEINAQAFKYQPFTTTPLPEDGFNKFYHVTVQNGPYGKYANETRGTDTDGDGTRLVKLSDKFKNYEGSDIQKNFKYATSGMIFYVDYTDEDDESCYNWFVIPFDPKPLAYVHSTPENSKEYEEAFPPYNKFIGSYFVAFEAGGSHTGKKSTNPHGLYTLEVSNVELLPNRYYFNGYTEAGHNNDKNYINWGTANTKPALVVRPLTGYKWDTYNDVKMFQLATNPEEGTLDVSLAATGYVDTDEKITDDDWLKATDGHSYPLYDDFYDPDDDDPEIPEDTVKMSAVNYTNIDEKYWNWQNYLVDYVDEDDDEDDVVYKYESIGTLSLLTEVYNGSLIHDEQNSYDLPQSWTTFNRKGKFRNALLRSNALDYTGITISGTDRQYWTDTMSATIKDGSALDPAMENEAGIQKNINNAINADDTNPDFYKFTYEKFMGTRIGASGFPLEVEYDVFNDKAGYWYHNSDNEELEHPTDGKVMYYPNVFNIGKTLNQETILNNLKLTETRSLSASGFSADDFEGLYVTDSKRNPIMYIDVGLGECKDGTSWSFSGYDNGEDPETARKNVKGLMLEID